MLKALSVILSGARSVTSAESNPEGATEGRDLRRREYEVRSNLQENENLHLFLIIGSLKPFAAAVYAAPPSRELSSLGETEGAIR